MPRLSRAQLRALPLLDTGATRSPRATCHAHPSAAHCRSLTRLCALAHFGPTARPPLAESPAASRLLPACTSICLDPCDLCRDYRPIAHAQALELRVQTSYDLGLTGLQNQAAAHWIDSRSPSNLKAPLGLTSNDIHRGATGLTLNDLNSTAVKPRARRSVAPPGLTWNEASSGLGPQLPSNEPIGPWVYACGMWELTCSLESSACEMCELDLFEVSLTSLYLNIVQACIESLPVQAETIRAGLELIGNLKKRRDYARSKLPSRGTSQLELERRMQLATTTAVATSGDSNGAAEPERAAQAFRRKRRAYMAGCERSVQGNAGHAQGSCPLNERRRAASSKTRGAGRRLSRVRGDRHFASTSYEPHGPSAEAGTEHESRSNAPLVLRSPPTTRSTRLSKLLKANCRGNAIRRVPPLSFRRPPPRLRPWGRSGTGAGSAGVQTQAALVHGGLRMQHAQREGLVPDAAHARRRARLRTALRVRLTAQATREGPFR
ncbi:hypothetical protein B0H15DRAFT_802974 [Mycena belliarum]|uniref:Uncharacterized protein n=1 Tax=Mycena belliarum TaxID=1033014 RepID=A0AAD6U3C3_9AGAR|nr:hypothetical protein B0H15DRAFT_802974 [Mycena belliae]